MTTFSEPVRLGLFCQPSAMIDLAGKLAPLASMAFYLAPIPTIQKVTRDGTVGDLPLLPYSSMAVTGFIWTAYGILQRQPAVWSANGLGFFLSLFYFIQFARFSPAKASTLPGSIQQHWNVGVFISVIALLATLAKNSKLVGLMCVAVCLSLYGSPLSAVKTVWSSKSASSIPLPASLATTVTCFLWSVVAIFKLKDMTIIIPNIIGLLLGILQLSLKLVFGNGQKAIQATTVGDITLKQSKLLHQDRVYVAQYAADNNRRWVGWFPHPKGAPLIHAPS